MNFEAVVLAGGVEHGELAEYTGVIYRPLLEVGGRPIIQHVLAALRGAATIGRVVLVAPDPVQQAVGDEAVDVRLLAEDSFVTNLVKGVTATSNDVDLALVFTGDLPLLTPAAVNDLAEQTASLQADVVYPIIPRESSERAFPGGKRTYVKLREGIFTGGNGMALTRAFVLQRQDLIKRLYDARKKPLQLARLFGLSFLFGLLTGRLTLPQLEARASRIISGRVAAIISAYPELGFDVDKLADLLLARRVIETRQRT